MPALSLVVLGSFLDLDDALPRPQNPVWRSPSWTRRQAPAGSDLAAAASSTGTSPSQISMPGTSSLGAKTFTLKPGTVVTTYIEPTNSPRPGGDTAQNTSSAEKGLDIKTIVFGSIGGVLGLLLVTVVIYQLLRCRQGRARANTRDVFWEKWRWGTYSPVQGDAVLDSHDISTASTLAGAQGPRGNGSLSLWWKKLSVFGTLGSGEKKESVEKKHKAGTLYKVKRLKRCGTFEIDSTTDLTSTTSR